MSGFGSENTPGQSSVGQSSASAVFEAINTHGEQEKVLQGVWENYAATGYSDPLMDKVRADWDLFGGWPSVVVYDSLVC